MNKIKVLTKQEKTEIRNRVRKIVLSSKDKIKIPFNYELTGSIKKGSQVSLDGNGKYDIDIDITTKMSDRNAQEIYTIFKNGFKNNPRLSETFVKKNRVIRVEKDDKFYIDIAIVDKFSQPSKIITKNSKGQYVWSVK